MPSFEAINRLTFVEGLTSAALSDEALKPDSTAILLNVKPRRPSSARIAHSSIRGFLGLSNIQVLPDLPLLRKNITGNTDCCNRKNGFFGQRYPLFRIFI